MKTLRLFLACMLTTSQMVANASEGKPSPAKPKEKVASRPQPVPATLPAQLDPPAAVEAQPTGKTIYYAAKDVITLHLKIRFTTMVVLPTGEKILEIVCGDRDFWQVQGNENFVYVKPSKPNAMTNLNLLTSSGNIYTFLLVSLDEGSSTPPDMKVFVEPKDQGMIRAMKAEPAFISSSELEHYRRQIAIAKEEIRKANERAAAEAEARLGKFLSEIRFSYKFDSKPPFNVKSIYHNGRFTFIQAEPEEMPTLYQVIDGQPSLVNFQVKDGFLVVDRVLDRAFLAIGKQKLAFIRKDH